VVHKHKGREVKIPALILVGSWTQSVAFWRLPSILDGMPLFGPRASLFYCDLGLDVCIGFLPDPLDLRDFLRGVKGILFPVGHNPFSQGLAHSVQLGQDLHGCGINVDWVLVFCLQRGSEDKKSQEQKTARNAGKVSGHTVCLLSLKSALCKVRDTKIAQSAPDEWTFTETLANTWHGCNPRSLNVCLSSQTQSRLKARPEEGGPEQGLKDLSTTGLNLVDEWSPVAYEVGRRDLLLGFSFWFFDVACGFLEFAISSVCPLSARYFLSPAKGGSLPPPGYSRAVHCFLCRKAFSFFGFVIAIGIDIDIHKLRVPAARNDIFFRFR
jgi:hypothetical protein